MILLESHSTIISNTLTEKFVSPSVLDIQFVDYDSIRFHLVTPEKKTKIHLSMSIRCWHELVEYGALDIIQREYGPYVVPTDPGYDVTLAFDTENLPQGEEQAALIRSVALLKRNALAAPFEKAFSEQKQLEAIPAPTDGSPRPEGPLMAIHYRDEEAIYVQASHDRVTVFFSTIFEDETDRIFGKVFLQEFVDARRLASLQTAPQVLYSSREPPLEIRNVPGLKRSEDVGYVTFEETISRIQLFRDYLHYHIKCSKAYMHSRMRHRVSEFLKILNRARPAPIGEKERKTITGRTFSQR
ncbi:putative ARC35-subunit of the Arp2/3 complex [Cantharellus anzutake]|uniref:putative ARC35-subunit of the Arp2/3 complex n=1 Tax=Cantharellus anzutake TaxID=1750568 RepID=UPI0019081868|nr:putative ARC35-subunit of the Arp2/3 complex [Cantharellus anzutake]KAF8339654.1 putative ARC35-subunit of the Arp2/3 complex [Cantharellus anzutake]